MYRLLNRKNLYPNNLVFSQNSAFVNGITNEGYTCNYCREMFCNQLKFRGEFYSFQIRHQTTKVVLNSTSLKKKRKIKNSKKYVELLEVMKNAANETKAPVRNMKPSHLSNFISNPSIKLDQLHKLMNSSVKQKSNSILDKDLLKIRQTVLAETNDSSHVDVVKCDSMVKTDINEQAMDDTAINTNMTLDQVVNVDVNPELINAARNAVLREYKRIEDVPLTNMDTATILTSSRWHSYDIRLIDEKLLKIIKDSYDKFRRDTVDSVKYNDFSKETIINPFTFGEMIPTESMTNLPLDEVYDFPASGVSIGPSNKQLEQLEIQGEIHEDIPEEICEEPNEIMQVTSNKLPSHNISKIKAPQSELIKKNIAELKMRSKEESLKTVLASHLEICISNNELEKAFQILMYYRRRGKRYETKSLVRDLSLFNILLQGFAEKGIYSRIAGILHIMKEDMIEPNIQTYVAIFECIERAKLKEKLQILERFKNEMDSKGITFNDLMNKGYFVKDQYETVLSSIRMLEPDFVPVHTRPNLDYVCPLLKDLNLDNLENNLHRIGLKTSPAVGLISIEELNQRLTQQIHNEIVGTIQVKNIINSEQPSEEILTFRKQVEELEDKWRKSVKTAFIKNMATLKSQNTSSSKALNIYPYLNILDVNTYVDLIMIEVNHLAEGSESYSETLSSLQRELGLLAYSKYKIKKMTENGVMDKLIVLYKEYCEWYINRSWDSPEEQYYNSRQKWQMLMHKHRAGLSADVSDIAWPTTVCQNVGKFLYNIILHELKININMDKKNCKERLMPVTYCLTRWSGQKQRVEVKIHPLVWRIWRGASRRLLTVKTVLSPSNTPPPPWIRAGKNVNGGYLITPPVIMRMPANVNLQWKRLEEAPMETLYPTLDSINQLGSIPWTINEPILDLQLKLFRSGGSKELNINQPPSVLDSELPSRNTSGMTKAEKSLVFRKKMAILRKKAELYSLWCESLYKLSLANHYRNSIFWLPHNVDFRGRAYSCSPHVTILGSDTARSLLKFALPKPLGPNGLRWLKLHVINLTGVMKKNTIDERLKYADDIMDDILDSADNPLEGQRWWAKSEDPWQTLACCMEIANAMRLPNPEEYMCSFPVQQDGSCNGLQHYAALGGDKAGAKSVNLVPSQTPQDVYSSVVTLVEESRKRDAAAGVKIAITLDGFINRKVIKQTIMTTVYGVTKFGARLQIAKKLKDIDDFPKEAIWESSTYLTGKTFESLREMFTSAKEIQDWFTDCAKLISGVCCESVEWVTPLGLPVVQPYHKFWGGSKGKGASLGSANGVYISEHTPTDQFQKPCLLKQKNAFPPNYIHSLDSSHMILTSLQCEARGITYVSVHDCFWTHPSHVDEMNMICRKQFVALHSQPILQDLSNFLVRQFGYDELELVDDEGASASKRRLNKVLKSVPRKGTFRLEEVLNSVYFFS